jgi:predicted alpha/beta-hydrolase family hydrolase
VPEQVEETTQQLNLPDGRAVTSIWTPPDGPLGWVFVYAPGAGSNVRDPFGAFAARELAPNGIGTLRFQFPYSEAGRKAPDREPVLESTWRAAIAAARARGARVVIGGRSMGGRISSQVVGQGERVDALGLFAYPLHPPGRPERRRDGHLGTLGAPALFCSGTNDAFASPDELRELTAAIPRSRLHLLEGADHGFAVPRSSGRTRQDVWTEAASELRGWLAALDA